MNEHKPIIPPIIKLYFFSSKKAEIITGIWANVATIPGPIGIDPKGVKQKIISIDAKIAKINMLKIDFFSVCIYSIFFLQ